MSTATTAPPAVARSSSKRQSSYTSPTAERPQRTPSSSNRSAAAHAEPHRSDPHSQSHGRAASMAQQQNLAGVARRDYDTTNVARQSSATRRSLSKDRIPTATTPQRTEPTRIPHRSDSRPNPQRYSTDAPRAQNSAGHGGSTQAHSRSRSDLPPQDGAAQVKRRTQVTAQTGVWALGKTIGAGSMGKVKLAKNVETGEQVAIKIVPRQSTEEHRTQRDRERADHSKEIRTAREAAIVTLLNHPYICGMRDVVRTNYHWYMLFEYVNGGQMLDYIISHGRLKEKPARKFGRQIASALDYCHRNSIVHRDLKIENILISKTGDIKIIDFGLSNLFAPKSHLKTFCGSLYFAAPELLQAKEYTGPEVDVWSFGIVLYVLVCGKVPFDDQSMPQLHAKIKKGLVDYPNWLGPDCKHLISRMLVTDPRQRASLTEVMAHPWMTKGFTGPPDSYLPVREPLQLPLDLSVVDKMTGFDFGPSEYIQRELTRVIESEEYQNAVRYSNRDTAMSTPGIEKKRGVFDFYKRRSSTTSRDTLPNISAEAVQLGPDLLTAFSPLISIYYLVREKQDRERLEANPGALTLPMSPGEMPLRMPDLPPPEAAYTNSNAYEIPGEKVTGGRSRPRARTHGEDDIPDAVKNAQLLRSTDQVTPSIVTTPAPQQPAGRKESVAGGLLRRFSTRRGKEPRGDAYAPPPLTLQQTPAEMLASPTPPRKSFSVRRSRKEASLGPMIHSAGSQPHQTQLLTPPLTAGGVLSRAGNKVLGRSSSVNSAEYRTRQTPKNASGGLPTTSSGDPPLTSGSDRSSVNQPRLKITEPPTSATEKPSASRTASLRTKSLGHARRESIQARRARRGDDRKSYVPEETDQDLAAGELTDSGEGQSEMKPVFLKGLFSVSTTSSRPLPVIRADIIRVLKQLGVDYTEIKGGFSCRHAPSIDLSKVTDVSPPSPERQNFSSPAHRRRISFGGFMGVDRERDDARDNEKSPRLTRRRGPDTSFTNSEDSEEERDSRRRGGPADRTAGETSTHVQSDMGENLVLRFEIFIVKVPLFSFHGIQFKKVSGGTWQYKNMAQKILDALRL